VAPGFSALVVMTLALAIGVNTAIFSMVGTVFYVDTPITDTETFAFFFVQNPERCAPRCNMSAREFLAYREGVPAFERLAAIRGRSGILAGGDEPLHVEVAEAAPSLWEVWGTPALLGRGFHPQEAAPGSASVVVLSHGFWQRHFGGARNIVGRRILLDGVDMVVVGVMDPVFELGGWGQIEVWQPLWLKAGDVSSDRRDLYVTGRLAAGATLEQARQQADAVARRLADEWPQSNRDWTPNVYSYSDGIVGEIFWPLMTILSLMVSVVMVMACSNIASMMLARGSARARELAIRAALGAGRTRIIRGLVLEGILLAVASAVLGIAVARASLATLAWMVGENADLASFLRVLEIDGIVLVFTVAIAAASPMLFSLLPALRITGASFGHPLNTGGASTSPMRARRLLVAGQVALALTLMVAAGTLGRTILGLYAMDLGYDGEKLLTMRVNLPERVYGDDASQQQFFRDAGERIRNLAELEAAAWVSHRPMAESSGNAPFRIRGAGVEALEPLPSAGFVVTEAGYLDLVGVNLLRGRMFGPQDTMETTPVVLVNELAVRRYWADADPLGTFVQFEGTDDADRWLEIVGVVTTLQNPDSGPRPLLYFPFAQNPRRAMALVSRPRNGVEAAAAAVRRVVWEVDPDQPVSDVRTMQQIRFDRMADNYAVTSMFSAFAGFALFMAAAGIYGVMSVIVAQRTREFGIRMALGGDRRVVLANVLRSAGPLVVGGALAGVPAGYALATLIASSIPLLDAADPVVYGTVTATLVVVAFASMLLPTWRASRVDPVIALHAE
jgi:putative ABC transport system permease protein